MSVKDLLGKIISGDREGAQEEFEQIMAEKASDGITEKRMEVAQSIFGEGKTPYENGKDDKEIEDKEAKDNEDDEEEKEKGDDDTDEKDDSEDDDEKDDDEKDAKKKVSEDTLDEGIFHVFHKVKDLDADIETDWVHMKKPDGSKHTYKTKAEANAVIAKKGGNIGNRRMQYKVVSGKDW